MELGLAARSQLSAFVAAACEEATGTSFADHAAFEAWAVAEHRTFWARFLRFADLLTEGAPEPVCTSEDIERAAFFPDLRLSYAENLLRCDTPADAARPAVIAHGAWGAREELTRGELRERVRAVAAQLTALGVGPGDIVAAVAGNNANAVVGALACAAIGAPFASAAPEMGPAAIIGRFEQLRPKVLMANLAVGGEAAPTALADRVAEVAAALPSLTTLIALDDGPAPRGSAVPCLRLAELMDGGAADGDWERFGFNHPLFVLFSSGTTGPPKCIVHGAGGTLLEHVKEHRLHVDLGPADRMFFHTSAAWMMWNWQLSALACGAAIVLYDGPLPGPDTLWRLAGAEEVTVFGTAPPYLQLSQDSGLSPRRELGLGHLRAVLSTGSILHDHQYDWVREHVGDVALQSISGGTDIIGCFVLGTPDRPVTRGWIQCRSLGLDVRALGGEAVGELVCANPFPSRPLGFLNDDGGTLFHDAYFAENPGFWTHGDLIEFDGEGQARLHGRSDGILNVGGVRIGPAEIYRALQGVAEVRESLAVEQDGPDGPRIVLAVVLREGAELAGRLVVHLRREIARNASPAHVPDVVVAVDELPRTHSGKRSERAARDAVNGVPVGNVDALANPASLPALRAALARADDERPAAAGPEPGTTVERVIAIWEAVLGVAPLGRDDAFFDVGGTSLAAVRVFQEIHDLLGVDLPLSTLLHAQTPAALAAVIDGPADRRVPPLVLLREGSAGRPVFFVHGVAGDVMHLRPLALSLDTERPVYGIQSRGLDPRLTPQERVEDMAEANLAAIRNVQPDGPYSIVGHSFGALVAFEMARRLELEGADVDALALVEPVVHHRCLSRSARVRFVTSLVAGRARRHQWRAPGSVLPPLQERVERANREAFRAYRPGPYRGDVTLLLADGEEAGFCDPLPVWRGAVAGTLDLAHVPGGHATVVGEPHAHVVAERLTALLATP